MAKGGLSLGVSLLCRRVAGTDDRRRSDSEISVDVHKEETKRWIYLNMRERRQKETESPLASRLRPETLEEVVGQQHIIGKDKLL